MRTLVMVFLAMAIAMGIFSSASAELRRVSVVVDPSSERIDQYVYRHDLSEIAKQELEAKNQFVNNMGYCFLISSQDVIPTQQELELDNSKWGNKNPGMQTIGGFASAEEVWYVSAYILSASESAIGGAVQNFGAAYRNSNVGVRVIVKRSLVGRNGRIVLQTMDSSTVSSTEADIAIGANIKIDGNNFPIVFGSSGAKDIRGPISKAVSVALQALENAPVTGAQNENQQKSPGPALPEDPIRTFWQMVEDLISAGANNEGSMPIVPFTKPANIGSKWIIVGGNTPVAVVQVKSPAVGSSGRFVHEVSVLGGDVPGAVKQGAMRDYKIIKYNPSKK